MQGMQVSLSEGLEIIITVAEYRIYDYSDCNTLIETLTQRVHASW